MLRGNPSAFADVWLPEGSERPLAETVRRSASSNQAFAAEITSWRGGILVGKTAFKSPSRPTPRPLLLEALHAFMRSRLSSGYLSCSFGPSTLGRSLAHAAARDGLASWTRRGTQTVMSAIFPFAMSRGHIATTRSIDSRSRRSRSRLRAGSREG